MAPKGAACEPCQKSYASDNALQAHLASRKHRERMAELESKKQKESEKKDAEKLEEVEDMVEDESTVATALKEDSRRARDYQRQLQHARTEVPTFPVIVSLHCALTY